MCLADECYKVTGLGTALHEVARTGLPNLAEILNGQDRIEAAHCLTNKTLVHNQRHDLLHPYLDKHFEKMHCVFEGRDNSNRTQRRDTGRSKRRKDISREAKSRRLKR